MRRMPNRIVDDGSGQFRMSSRARTKAAAIAEPVETPSHGLLLIAPTTTPKRVPADRASAPSKRAGRFWCMANFPSGEGETVRRYRFEIARGGRPSAWFFISVPVSILEGALHTAGARTVIRFEGMSGTRVGGVRRRRACSAQHFGSPMRVRSSSMSMQRSGQNLAVSPPAIGPSVTFLP